MGYFYFKPGCPQYFFPENFKKHIFLLSMFQPYNFKGKLSWWAWKNFKLVRKMFFLEDIERFIPESLIRKHLIGNPILAFNTGSPGPEQKITALGFYDNEPFFIKFGQNNVARINVRNEAKILKQLQHLAFVPKLFEMTEHNEFTLLKTSLLLGKRFTSFKVNNDIIAILLRIIQLDIKTEKNFTGNVRIGFAHGDFCPWNLMATNGNIEVFDWEMAGSYPLGYDLFTYIFQPAFLLNPKTNISQLIGENEEFINAFFKTLNISSWQEFLIGFAEVKLQLETDKKNQRLMPFYKELLKYAKKA
jgi:hypothetical protein